MFHKRREKEEAPKGMGKKITKRENFIYNLEVKVVSFLKERGKKSMY